MRVYSVCLFVSCVLFADFVSLFRHSSLYPLVVHIAHFLVFFISFLFPFSESAFTSLRFFFLLYLFCFVFSFIHFYDLLFFSSIGPFGRNDRLTGCQLE